MECVMGIVKDKERHIIAYGEVKKGSGQTPDADTNYEIGSVSKTITGLLLADMVERDERKVNEPLQGLLPHSMSLMTR